MSNADKLSAFETAAGLDFVRLSTDEPEFGRAPSGAARDTETTSDAGEKGLDSFNQASLLEREKIVASLAKSYEPVIGKVVGVLDGAGCRLVVREAKRAKYPREDVERLEEAAAMSDDCKGTMRVCSARILARHVQNPEIIDVLGLSGALIDWSSNLLAVVQEIRRDRPRLSVVPAPIVNADERTTT